MSTAIFFQNQFFKKNFEEHYQSVKQFESRSGPTDLGPNGLKGYLQTKKLPASKERVNIYTELLSGNRDLIFGLCIPVNNFSVILGRVILG